MLKAGIRFSGILVSSSLLCGCTPSWQIVPGSKREVVKIQDVVKNIDEQLACAFDERTLGRREALYGLKSTPGQTPPLEVAWNNFLSSHPVASVQLTLQVTDIQGISPNVTFLDPYAPIAPSTMSTTQGAWALGVQLNGNEGRQIILNYIVDTDKLRNDLYDAPQMNPKNPYVINCTRQGDWKDRPGWLPLELHGDLGFAYTLDGQLVGLQEAARYGIPPVTSPPPGLAKLNSTSLSLQNTFTVNEGINTGPSWKLVNFQGPTGGGGGGGSGGGSSSGGSQSGMMSGGGGGWINFSRSSFDQVLISIFPVCATVTQDVNWSSLASSAGCATVSAAGLKALNTAKLKESIDRENLSRDLSLHVSIPQLDALKGQVSQDKENVSKAESAVSSAANNALNASKAQAASQGVFQNLIYSLNPSLNNLQ